MAKKNLPKGPVENQEGKTEAIAWINWYLRCLSQAGEIYSRELEKRYRVSQPQLSCLLALHRYGGMPISKLAAGVRVEPSTLTGIVDRLETKGLVQRERSRNDRRVVTVNLTEAGTALVGESPNVMPKSIVEGLNNLSDEDVTNIISSLHTLVSMLGYEPR